VKKVLLSVLFAAVLVLSLAAPVFAENPGSQVFYLYSANMTDAWGNTELYMSSTQALPANSSTNIASGASEMWIADKAAQADVTYPNDNWAIRFGTDVNWGTDVNGESNFKVDIGYWDGTDFTVLAMDSSPVWYMNHYESQFQGVPDDGQTIPEGTYLAVVVYNNSASDHPILTGYKFKINGSSYYSCLTSPQSDPGYPLPEIGAIILLGGGLAGLGGFMIIRRKKAVIAV
jgi:hypothetical protein